MSSAERRRVVDGPGVDEEPSGQLVAADVRCDGDAPEVLARTREVMAVVVANADGEWPDDDQWRRLLPDWFVAASAPEPGAEQVLAMMARRASLSPRERRDVDAEQDQRWSVGAFLSDFDPDERTWYWWSAEVLDANLCRVTFVADQWPTMVGALNWLLRAAGGREVECDMV